MSYFLYEKPNDLLSSPVRDYLEHYTDNHLNLFHNKHHKYDIIFILLLICDK
jgi:hypothetical protein